MEKKRKLQLSTIIDVPVRAFSHLLKLLPDELRHVEAHIIILLTRRIYHAKYLSLLREIGLPDFVIFDQETSFTLTRNV